MVDAQAGQTGRLEEGRSGRTRRRYQAHASSRREQLRRDQGSAMCPTLGHAALCERTLCCRRPSRALRGVSVSRTGARRAAILMVGSLLGVAPTDGCSGGDAVTRPDRTYGCTPTEDEKKAFMASLSGEDAAMLDGPRTSRPGSSSPAATGRSAGCSTGIRDRRRPFPGLQRHPHDRRRAPIALRAGVRRHPDLRVVTRRRRSRTRARRKLRRAG